MPDIYSTANKWKMYDDESDKEESLSRDHTDYSEISSYHIKCLDWKEEKYQYWLWCDWLDVIVNPSH